MKWLAIAALGLARAAVPERAPSAARLRYNGSAILQRAELLWPALPCLHHLALQLQ